ncbi:MAG: acetyl-CoA synthase subunit gamma [Deltaproteobacteria bacterium]|jgi:hypothetical protein|nr:acetyl-CoA synthase subunit gamma [Deltaproteobacteria bacterium]MBT4527222.1 acetyl-CoA synthase subunit gamma [Deltaproteobacteria bacterium]
MSDIPTTFIPLSDLTGSKDEVRPDWVIGSVSSGIGPIPQISCDWNQSDKVGQIKARINNTFRMKYAIQAGLYAVGNPDGDSPVLLSANYKLSFDILRRELKTLNVWIIVLDTKGINVWCAAGKGTFGTDEIIRQISHLKLERVVKHRKVISPQLGAPGIKAHVVKKMTGFNIKYGPVLAKDIQKYLQDGLKATKEMRRISFKIIDRMILTPMEISLVLKQSWKYGLGILIFFGIMPTGILFKNAFVDGLPFILLLFVAILTGAFITPALLPWIPFRAFFRKGFLIGLLPVILLHYLSYKYGGLFNDPFLLASAYLLVPTLSSYLAFNFTGCTTYTNPAGVNKELKSAFIVYAITIIVSIILLVIYKLLIWGVLWNT